MAVLRAVRVRAVSVRWCAVSEARDAELLCLGSRSSRASYVGIAAATLR